jgi:membrane protease YdiL (CAAX protease family)
MVSTDEKLQQGTNSMIAFTLDSKPVDKDKSISKEEVVNAQNNSVYPEKKQKEDKKKSDTSPAQQILNTWAVIILIWALYRHFFKTDLPIWADEFFIKPLIFVFPLYFIIRIRQGKNFFKEIWLRADTLKEDFLYGSFIGLVLFGSAALINLSKFGTVINPNSEIFSQDSVLMIVSSISLYFLISVATSISEEILSRGFLLNKLNFYWNNVYTATLASSLLYFALRIPILFTNPEMNGMVLLQVLVTDLILSFTASFLYLQSKSLTLPIIVHAYYTFSLYLFLS